MLDFCVISAIMNNVRNTTILHPYKKGIIMNTIKELYETTTANFTEIKPGSFVATLGEYNSHILYHEGEWLIRDEDGDFIVDCHSFENAVYHESMHAISQYIQRRNRNENLIEFFEDGELLEYTDIQELFGCADLIVCKTAEATQMFAWLCDCEDFYLESSERVRKTLVPTVFTVNRYDRWARAGKSVETLTLKSYGL